MAENKVIRKAMEDPEYREAWNRLQTLQGDLAAKDRLLQEHLGRVANRREWRDPVTVKAEALLGGEAVPDQDDRGTMKQLREEMTVLRRAIELQRGKVEEIRARVGRETAKALLPRHRELVRRAVLATVALAEAAQEEYGFREDLAAGGLPYSAVLDPLPAQVLKLRLHGDGRHGLESLIAWAVGYGALTDAEAVKILGKKAAA